MMNDCLQFLNKIADDFIVGLATSFSDRSLTEQLKRDISYRIDNIENPLVRMFIGNNVEKWITTIESYSAPFVKMVQNDSPTSVDVARNIIKDSFNTRIDTIADRIKKQIELEKGKINNNVSSIQSDNSSNGKLDG